MPPSVSQAEPGLIYCPHFHSKKSARRQLVRSFCRCLILYLPCAISAAAQQTSPPPAPAPLFTLQEVMIPVRDGVHLQTAILTPVSAAVSTSNDQKTPLPILFRRTPYGV